MLKKIQNRERGVLINLYEDERIYIVIRKHWFSFVSTIVLTTVLVLIFFIGSIIFYGSVRNGAANSNLVTDNLGQGAYIIFGSIYLLSVLGFFYVSWLDYYLDVFILTNKRILRFEQLVLFGQKLSETSFQHVQAVNSQVKGFIYTLLNIGTVFIETAGDDDNFTFPIIKDPGHIATEILELQKNMWSEDELRNDLSDNVQMKQIKDSNKPEKEISEPIKEPKETKESEEIIKTKEEPNFSVNDEVNRSLGIIQPLVAEGLADSSSVQAKSTANEVLSPVIESKKEIPVVMPQIEISANIEKKFSFESEKKHYQDGRRITTHGVIWQADQEVTEDILWVLNQMEK